MISVIIPVYNVENYIVRCIESVLSQSYSDYEVILVDDGSTDLSGQICDKYALRYPNVHVYHKLNGGLSDARNFGLEKANGEEVTFVDSDDYVSSDYLYVLSCIKRKYKADIAVGGIKKFNEGKSPKPLKFCKEFSYSGIEALEKMLYQDTLDTSACAMLLSRNLARMYLFPIGKFHEDEFTTYKYYSSVARVAVTTKSIYFYLQRCKSIMHSYGKPMHDELEAADNLVEVCERDYPSLIRAAKCKKFSDYCQVYLSVDNLDSNDLQFDQRIYNYLKSYSRDAIRDNKARLKNRIAALIIVILGVSGLSKVNKLIESRVG